MKIYHISINNMEILHIMDCIGLAKNFYEKRLKSKIKSLKIDAEKRLKEIEKLEDFFSKMV